MLDISTLLCLGISKDLKSMVSGGSQIPKNISLQHHLRQRGSSKDFQAGVILQEQQQRQGEVHAEFPGQVLIPADCANRLKSGFWFLSAFIARLLKHLPPPNHMPFTLSILFHPFSFTCFLLPRLLFDSAIALKVFCNQKKNKVVTICLVVLSIISRLLCYTFFCCILYSH